MLSTWFAHPALLFALLALPVSTALGLYAYLRRRQMIARLGNTPLLRKNLLVRPRVRRWKGICFTVGLMLLALACAGPQWGIDKSAQHRKGRDVFLVFDLSRSMLAEQPSRRELATLALHHLADAFEKHGGHRVALVGFASKARLFFPLTQDYDHLRHTLDQIDTSDYASVALEEPLSGTRIGTALKLAIAQCDPKRVNRPVIVLLSDGDDPAGDDEWLEGVHEAKAKQIRIHAVGFGDPGQHETIPFGRDVQKYEGQPILTKLDEKRLEEIARGAHGIYLPARTGTFPLGAYVQHLLDADEVREEEPAADALPMYQLRYAWFLLPALLLFMLTMLLNEGPPPPNREPKVTNPKPRFASSRGKAVSFALALVALLGISAAQPPDAEALLRRGNEAFAQKDYESALRWFEQAEAMTADPGLVAFNKGAAYYRLGRFKEAVECYRRALQDDLAPPARQARAYFDLGNALLQHAGDSSQQLGEAVAAYRACLHLSDTSPDLRANARYNLELAQMLWLKAREKEPPKKDSDPPPKKDPFETKEPKESDTQYVPVDPTKKHGKQEAADVPADKSKKLSSGTIQVLPDDDKTIALPPEDTLRTLAERARLIAAARRLQRNPDGPASLSTKDW